MLNYKLDVLFIDKKIKTNLNELVQHDYNSIKLKFTFDVVGARYLFKLKNEDNSTVMVAEIENNELVFGPGVLSKVGYYYYEISVYDTDSKITNYAKGNFYVREILINTDEIVEPDDRVPVLDKLINDVNAIETTVNTNEVTRQGNETTRISNENTRIQNETAREEYIAGVRQAVEDGEFDGEDGYTPVKGVDYYTEAEKEELKDEITDDIVGDATSQFNQNAAEKTTAYDNNASSKLTAYNDNASEKLDEYNDNATNKTNDFNNNAESYSKRLDRAEMVYNALPKVEGEGTNLTLDDTAEAPMKMSLGANMEQASTIGKNICVTSKQILLEDNTAGTWANDVYTYNGITYTPVFENNALKYININGTTSNNTSIFFLNKNLEIPQGTYILNGCPSGGGDNSYKIVDNISKFDDKGTGSEKEFATDRTIELRIRVASGYTANNIKFYPMIRLSSITDDTYEPYTNGTSPNPYYPQDIHTISGDNTIKVANSDNTQEQSLPLNLPVENKINIDNFVPATSASTITKLNTGINIKNTTNGYGAKINIENLKANTDYYISYKWENVSNGLNRVYVFAGSTQATVLAYLNNGTGFKFNTGNNTSINIWFYVQANSTGEVNYKDIQLEQGTKANSYTPYGTPALEYSKIGDYEDEFVIPSGKNLFNIKGDINTRYNGQTGNYNTANNNNLTSNYSNNDGYPYGQKIFVGAGKTVTISAKVKSFVPNNITGDVGGILAFNDNIVTGVAYVTFNNNETGIKTLTFTPTTDYIYVAFGFVVPTTRQSSVTFTDIQVEYGDIATDYEPYGNGKWYLKKNVGKVVLNGSENWNTASTSQTGKSRWTLNITNVKPTASTTEIGGILSNYYKAVAFAGGSGTYNNVQGISVANFGSQIAIYDDTYNTDLANFKTWLSTHNTEVDYILATPQYIPLNDTLQSQLTEIYNWLKSYKDQTNISQVNNDLPFVIKASAVYDLNKLLTRVETLEAEV